MREFFIKARKTMVLIFTGLYPVSSCGALQKAIPALLCYAIVLTGLLMTSGLLTGSAVLAQDMEEVLPSGQKNRIKVATTFTVIADMARNVAGDKAEVVSITRPGAEIHGYKPTPKDIVRTKNADLVLYNGLNLERWFKKFLRDVKDVPFAVITAGIEPLSIYEGPYSGKPNPHAWMSPENGLIYVQNIRDALIRIDPENEAYYRKNAAAYAEEIKDLHRILDKKLAFIPAEQRWLVTSEGAFSYMAKDFDFKELYLWPINADRQGTPQQVKEVIDKVREYEIPVVFSESTVSDKPARQVAAETGAHYGGALYVDSLSKEGGLVPTYLDLLSYTVSVVAEGYKQAHESTGAQGSPRE